MGTCFEIIKAVNTCCWCGCFFTLSEDSNNCESWCGHELQFRNFFSVLIVMIMWYRCASRWNISFRTISQSAPQTWFYCRGLLFILDFFIVILWLFFLSYYDFIIIILWLCCWSLQKQFSMWPEYIVLAVNQVWLASCLCSKTLNFSNTYKTQIS